MWLGVRRRLCLLGRNDATRWPLTKSNMECIIRVIGLFLERCTLHWEALRRLAKSFQFTTTASNGHI